MIRLMVLLFPASFGLFPLFVEIFLLPAIMFYRESEQNRQMHKHGQKQYPSF